MRSTASSTVKSTRLAAGIEIPLQALCNLTIVGVDSKTLGNYSDIVGLERLDCKRQEAQREGNPSSDLHTRFDR